MLLIYLLIAQLSPGDLHEVHKSLEGLKNCTNCHMVGSKDFQKQCLACHQLVQKTIQQKKGFHGHLKKTDCQDCHKDHFGRDFQLIHWKGDQNEFDHSRTGFKLNKPHKKVGCRKCHNEGNNQQKAEILKAGKRFDRTFMGLNTECASCHKDPHQSRLKERCETCHTGDTWRPADGFSHAKTDFALKGAHLKVKCEQCHQDFRPDANGFVLAKPLGSSCLSCHKDHHKGQLPENCLTCHSMDKWKPAVGFNHDTTRFPLSGLHTKTQCNKCHKDQTGIPKYKNLKFSKCSDCHRSPHREKLTQSCATCHTTKGWFTMKVKGFDHASTGFPLKGKHKNVSCQSCHSPEKPFILKTETHQCTNCHKDPHISQFTKFDSNNCENCHSESGFTPSRFSWDQHQQTQFPLKGSHLAVACRDCHVPVNLNDYRFKFNNQTCSGCHKSPHSNLPTKTTPETCTTCHAEEAWSQISFSHDNTGFKLQGAHDLLTCRSCHLSPMKSWSKVKLSPATTHRSGSISPESCTVCHKDPHQSQLGSTCLNCHDYKTWKPSKFRHDQTRFPLDGAHQNLACSQCHQKSASGLTRYKPIDPTCTTCHGKSGRPK